MDRLLSAVALPTWLKVLLMLAPILLMVVLPSLAPSAAPIVLGADGALHTEDVARLLLTLLAG